MNRQEFIAQAKAWTKHGVVVGVDIASVQALTMLLREAVTLIGSQEPTNDERADRVGQLVPMYCGLAGTYPNEDFEFAVDFLTDLRHWCAREGVGFNRACSISYKQYKAEK